jgi:hypothetical protein
MSAYLSVSEYNTTPALVLGIEPMGWASRCAGDQAQAQAFQVVGFQFAMMWKVLLLQKSDYSECYCLSSIFFSHPVVFLKENNLY